MFYNMRWLLLIYKYYLYINIDIINIKMIVLVNPSNFRYCVLLSVLSERGILIKELNENEEEKGIKESEMKLLKLI